MESSADRYLHKKFKKQLNTDLNNVEKEEKKIGCGAKGNEPSLQNCGNFGSVTGMYMSDTSVANNEDNVPKLSTNNTNTFSIVESSNVVKSSISHVNIVNAVKQSEKSAKNVLQEDSERSKQAGELVDPQSSNSCISYVIPNSSRVEYYTPPELQFRAVNFDTRFNVSEPIPSADTSSILDNVYSKQYVTSKLVNVEKAGDISSNSSLVNDHGTNQEECYNNSKSADTKNDNHVPELSANEKSSTGKYICSYCNLACSKPSVLQKHIRAHTNERPYPCISCGFSFKTRSNLYKHCRSRTHANRVLGNKAQEIHNEIDVDSQNKMEYAELNNSFDSVHEDAMAHRIKDKPIMEERSSCIEKIGHDGKSKPYKPRFHTAKAFFDDTSRDNQKNVEDQKVPVTVQNNRPSNSALLSLHISEVINKNNAIINSNESLLLRKRSLENNQLELTSNESLPLRHNEIIYPQQIQTSDERTQEDQPLNLTNKGRKRCLSEATPEPTMQTSLIKELLLKNLYADSMQCPHCKMIFQTVTELELHKLRSCKAFIKSGARYSRSSSVNVASILTKNKNAFADIPHLQNTTFPLKSPGPFLGKTRLVESDKSKSFSFDDGLPNFQSNLNNSNDLLKTTLRYSISPLTIQHDRIKKTPVKMFGGEVKITQTSGEIKSFKIDGKDEFEKYGTNGNFPEFSSRLSENRVVKSCLQSGGTVVQNKPNYSGKQEAMRSSPEIIRVYENKSLSPNIDIVSLEKNKFTFERSLSHDLDGEQKLNSEQSADRLNFQNAANSYKYPNIMDFSQNAVKQIAPNIKQPNLTIPGLPVPNRLSFSRSTSLIFEPKHSPPKMFDPISFSRSPMESSRPNVINFSEASKPQESEKHLENIRFAQKQILLQQNMTHEPPSSSITSPSVYNPLHLMVNGKVVRYVPGIPGPVAAEVPTDVAYGGNQPTSISSHVRPQKCNTRLIVTESSSYSMKSSETRMSTGPAPKAKSSECAMPPYSGLLQIDKKHLEHDRLTKSPKFSALHVNISEPTTPKFAEMKSPNIIKPTEIKSPAPKNDIKPINNLIPPSSIIGETAKKFSRPNTLALKPSIAAHKQHHGLTPTKFNQILISPDTPRVAKKYMQHFLHGNYFSYLGLKSSTKPVYCTLNKTQPFYVPHHFKKLSMYSEWRQQDNKGDKLYASCYDPRQRQQKYVMAGRGTADLIVHSSYKFVVNESCSSRIEDHNKANSILGGYESNEDYTYVRGRGRGRYVCDQCGIRCKKPSMLKKHIRTHTNDRPYTCSHCNFSFKTKGNLTKHMKSKAHTKNYTASSSSSSSTQQSGTPSSESDTDDSGMDSSDESTRQQEHEAAYGLLSLSQKTTHNKTSSSSTSSNSVCSVGFNSIENRFNFMNTEQITQVNNSNFAKNKILDQVTVNFIGNKIMNEIPLSIDHGSKELLNVVQFLGRTNISRPLTYPYTSEVTDTLEKSPSSTTKPSSNFEKHQEQFNVERRSHSLSPVLEHNKVTTESEISFESNHSDKYDFMEEVVQKQPNPPTTPILKVNDCVISDSAVNLKRKLSDLDEQAVVKLQKPHIEFEAMDLSMPSSAQKRSPVRYNGDSFSQQEARINHQVLDHRNSDNYQEFYTHNGDAHNANEVNFLSQDSVDEVENVVNLKTSARYIPSNDQINVNYVYQESNPSMVTTFTEIPSMDYDNSAMETLADVATKQVKLEKNTLAKSVASEYLKLATKQECQSGEGIREGNNFISSSKEVNDMIVKSEENKSCSICAKSFNKPSQLRLHMNIHYLERPFRCDPCSVSFRTKGHLQKHERSASHHNKLSSSPLLSSSEPRPFKCSDCNIAFRIHGHLAKHLRSKMHIMKLECLAKIPFGLYAELERANSLLTEINTTDGDQCLESLKVLAKKVFMNDPSKLNQLDVSLNNTEASDS